MSYADFIASKRKRAGQIGRDCDPSECHPMLHDWQADAVAWAVRTGRAAIFWDCGLGKTFAQIEWARLSAETALILAPLSVARQTVREARKIDADVRYARHGDEITGAGLWITNYEMAHHFDMSVFGALVLDESSILKNVDGKTRKFLTAHAGEVPLRLACTATPAPNDVAELTNHAEFLGLMRREEMLAAYFVNDEKEWRLKGHARAPMFRWMASWAHALMFKTLRRDSSMTRPALADYLLVFKRPGENAVPIVGDVDNETWIDWARPIWTGIRETDTLNTAAARDDGDERHICPLQLPLIERCVRLWSNAGETVLSPFAGIGSEGYMAVKLGREFIGCELKPSYWATAVENLTAVSSQTSMEVTA